MKLVINIVGLILIAATLLSMVHSSRWWVRSADFPRAQIAALLALLAILHGLTMRWTSAFDVCLGLALLFSLAYQGLRVLPYTPLWRREVVDAVRGDGMQTIRILISNVLMENRRSPDLLKLVDEADPDVILAVETDAWWDEQLKELDKGYPYSIKHPQDNFFGMLMFSRLELGSTELRFLVDDEIPSIRTTVKLRSGKSVEFFGMHPRPPEPQRDSDERDAELLIVGREVRESRHPAIVAGDLNDVAWSDTTSLFRKVSGLLDPRRGRGMFSTFHAGYPMLRWPLDHIFHGEQFTLVDLKRLRSIGSDHFPVLAELRLDPSAAVVQTAPEPKIDNLEVARQRIPKGLNADA